MDSGIDGRHIIEKGGLRESILGKLGLRKNVN